MREEQIGDCRLILGDCREYLGEIPADAVIVSDPPYGIAYRHGGGGSAAPGCRGGSSLRRNGTAQIFGDGAPFDPRPILAWPCLLFGADHFYSRLPEGGTLHVWDKHTGRGCSDSFADAEFIWTSWRRKSEIIRYLWKGILKDGKEGREPRCHQNQKPTEVMRRCLQILPASSRLIADPYMGSGSTALACIRAGHPFIGIEIDPAHFATACRRIEQAYRQTDLFREPPAPKPEQMVLVA